MRGRASLARLLPKHRAPSELGWRGPRPRRRRRRAPRGDLHAHSSRVLRAITTSEPCAARQSEPSGSHPSVDSPGASPAARLSCLSPPRMRLLLLLMLGAASTVSAQVTSTMVLYAETGPRPAPQCRVVGGPVSFAVGSCFSNPYAPSLGGPAGAPYTQIFFDAPRNGIVTIFFFRDPACAQFVGALQQKASDGGVCSQSVNFGAPSGVGLHRHLTRLRASSPSRPTRTRAARRRTRTSCQRAAAAGRVYAGRRRLLRRRRKRHTRLLRRRQRVQRRQPHRHHHEPPLGRAWRLVLRLRAVLVRVPGQPSAHGAARRA